MREVARYASDTLNKVFGNKIFSIHAIGVSACLSTISYCLIEIANWIYFSYQEDFENFGAIIFVLCVMIVICCVFIKLAAWVKSKVILRLWLVCAFLLPVITILGMEFTLYGPSLFKVIIGDAGDSEFIRSIMVFQLSSIIIGVVCDVVFLAITRWVLRWSSGISSFSQIAIVISVNAFLAFTLFVGPYLFLVQKSKTIHGQPKYLV